MHNKAPSGAFCVAIVWYNIYMKSYNEIPEKPLTASVNTKMPRTDAVFFFERENGEIIHADEKTARSLMMGRNQVLGQQRERYRHIGTGSGQTFARYLKEAQAMFYEKGLEASQAHIRAGFDAELEEARGNLAKPRNFDTMGFNGNPVDISKL